MEARIVGAAASVLLHAGLLLALNLSTAPAEPAHRNERADGESVPMRLLPSPDIRDGEGMACPTFYTGIGIKHKRGEVVEILAGGPADRAGLHLGDLLMEPSTLMRDGYSVGRVLNLHVLRSGELQEVRVRIEKICFEPE